MEQVMDQQAGMELTDDNVEQVGFAAAGWPPWTGRPMSCAALTERQRSSCGRDPHSSPTHLAAVCACWPAAWQSAAVPESVRSSHLSQHCVRGARSGTP